MNLFQRMRDNRASRSREKRQPPAGAATVDMANATQGVPETFVDDGGRPTLGILNDQPTVRKVYGDPDVPGLPTGPTGDPNVLALDDAETADVALAHPWLAEGSPAESAPAPAAEAGLDLDTPAMWRGVGPQGSQFGFRYIPGATYAESRIEVVGPDGSATYGPDHPAYPQILDEYRRGDVQAWDGKTLVSPDSDLSRNPRVQQEILQAARERSRPTPAPDPTTEPDFVGPSSEGQPAWEYEDEPAVEEPAQRPATLADVLSAVKKVPQSLLPRGGTDSDFADRRVAAFDDLRRRGQDVRLGDVVGARGWDKSVLGRGLGQAGDLAAMLQVDAEELASRFGMSLEEFTETLTSVPISGQRGN